MELGTMELWNEGGEDKGYKRSQTYYLLLIRGMLYLAI